MGSAEALFTLWRKQLPLIIGKPLVYSQRNVEQKEHTLKTNKRRLFDSPSSQLLTLFSLLIQINDQMFWFIFQTNVLPFI
jgi:hypothetical protein